MCGEAENQCQRGACGARCQQCKAKARAERAGECSQINDACGKRGGSIAKYCDAPSLLEVDAAPKAAGPSITFTSKAARAKSSLKEMLRSNKLAKAQDANAAKRASLRKQLAVVNVALAGVQGKKFPTREAKQEYIRRLHRKKNRLKSAIVKLAAPQRLKTNLVFDQCVKRTCRKIGKLRFKCKCERRLRIVENGSFLPLRKIKRCEERVKVRILGRGGGVRWKCLSHKVVPARPTREEVLRRKAKIRRRFVKRIK